MNEQTFTISQQLHTEALNAQAAELSRLRELVKEMREALVEVRPSIPREVLALWCTDRNELIAKADAILGESAK